MAHQNECQVVEGVRTCVGGLPLGRGAPNQACCPGQRTSSHKNQKRGVCGGGVRWVGGQQHLATTRDSGQKQTNGRKEEERDGDAGQVTYLCLGSSVGAFGLVVQAARVGPIPKELRHLWLWNILARSNAGADGKHNASQSNTHNKSHARDSNNLPR